MPRGKELFALVACSECARIREKPENRLPQDLLRPLHSAAGFRCHTDRILLGDPTYVEALNLAYRESFVFKFADRVSVRFQCEIRLCMKEDDGCDGVTVRRYLCTLKSKGQPG